MTVEAMKTKVIYEGNGAVAAFPVPFKYSKTDDIRLLFTDATGVDANVTSNYQVNVNSSGDTSVTIP